MCTYYVCTYMYTCIYYVHIHVHVYACKLLFTSCFKLCSGVVTALCDQQWAWLHSVVTLIPHPTGECQYSHLVCCWELHDNAGDGRVRGHLQEAEVEAWPGEGQTGEQARDVSGVCVYSLSLSLSLSLFLSLSFSPPPTSILPPSFVVSPNPSN